MSQNVPDLQNPAAHGLRGVFDLASALHKVSVFSYFLLFFSLFFSKTDHKLVLRHYFDTFLLLTDDFFEISTSHAEQLFTVPAWVLAMKLSLKTLKLESKDKFDRNSILGI